MSDYEIIKELYPMPIDNSPVVGITIIFIVFGIISGLVGIVKGRGCLLWLIVGILLGPIGLLAIVLIPTDESSKTAQEIETEQLELELEGKKKCPFCKKKIQINAIRCKYCKRFLTHTQQNPDSH